MFRNQTNFKQPFRSLNYPPHTSSLFSHYMLSIIIFQKKKTKIYRTYWMWEKNFFILCMNILLFFTYNRHIHTHMLYQLVNKTLEARLFYLLLHQFAQLFMNLSIRYCAMMMMMMMMKCALLLFYFYFLLFGDEKIILFWMTCQWLLTFIIITFCVRGDLVKYALDTCGGGVCGFIGSTFENFHTLISRKYACSGLGMKKKVFCV